MSIDGSSVHVFVWHGSSSQKLGMGSFVPSFGHVALETRVDGVVRYISFWPGNCDTQICRRKEPHYHTKEIDNVYEERPPDAPPYVLKSLNVEKINAWYDTHKDDFSWVHHGSSSILKGPDEYNCAGLSYRLLEEGGIRQIVPQRSTQNVKRIFASIFSSFAAFAAMCYWSSHIIRPLSQFPHLLIEFGIRVMAVSDSVYKLVHTLKNVCGHIANAELALTNVYCLELGSNLQLRDRLSPIIERIKTHPSFAQVDSIPTDPSLESRSLATKFDALFMKDFAGYSPFLTLGGIASVSTLALAVGLAFLNHKIVTDVITPANVEDLVLCAANKEKEQLSSRKISVLSEPFIWVMSALGVASIGFYFFKENLSFRKMLGDALLNENIFLRNS